MNELMKKWAVFFNIVLDPWTLLLSGSVVALFVFSIGETNSTITSLLFVLITIASAILGGRITKHWVDITEGGIVIARGKSAVRSLKQLLRNITALEQRIVIFSANQEEITNHPEVTKRNYEEIREFCNLLQEETVNSIENWTDIVPEADIKTQIGLISELKQAVQKKEEELQNLNNKLNNMEGDSVEKQKQLKAEIKEKEKQILALNHDIFENKINLRGLSAIGEAKSFMGLKGFSSLSNSSLLTNSEQNYSAFGLLDDPAHSSLIINTASKTENKESSLSE